MNHEKALQSAIIDDPECDTLRLVYADWLDEHGQPERAEFIRGQIRLAILKPWDDEFTPLEIRCKELLRLHPQWGGWLLEAGHYDQYPHGCGGPIVFDRGFPARVKMTTPEFMASADQMFAEFPIRRVTFLLETPVGESGWSTFPDNSYNRHPAIARIPELGFGFCNQPHAVQGLQRCLDRAESLRFFGIGGCRFSVTEARAIFAAPAVQQVQTLQITGSPLSTSCEADLAQARFANLRRLVRVWLPDLAWLKADWVPQLETMILDDPGDNIQLADTVLLADCLTDMHLQMLSLGGMNHWPLDDSAAGRLGAAISKSTLRSFSMNMPYQSTPALTRSLLTSLNSLRYLFIQCGGFDRETVNFLVQTQVANPLRTCGLSHVTPDGVAALASGPGLPNLTSLYLGLFWDEQRPALPEAIQAVLSAGTLPRLTRLSIGDCRPWNAATASGYERSGGPILEPLIAAVAGNHGAAQLQELNLTGMMDALRPAAVRALVDSPHLDNLRLLEVQLALDDKESENLLRSRFGRRVKCNGFYEPW